MYEWPVDNLDSGPLLAQAIEFRKGTSCDPCLFKALAGPKTVEHRWTRIILIFLTVWLNRRDTEQPRCLKAKFRYPVHLSAWRYKLLSCNFYGDRRSVRTKYCKSLRGDLHLEHPLILVAMCGYWPDLSIYGRWLGNMTLKISHDEMPDFLWTTKHGIVAMRNHSLMDKAATIW